MHYAEFLEGAIQSLSHPKWIAFHLTPARWYHYWIAHCYSVLRKNFVSADEQIDGLQNMGIAIYDSKFATRLFSPPSYNSNLSDLLWVIRLNQSLRIGAVSVTT